MQKLIKETKVRSCFLIFTTHLFTNIWVKFKVSKLRIGKFICYKIFEAIKFIEKELTQWTCEVNGMGENSSFIFTSYVKTVPVYDFELVWVVLHPPVRDVSKRFTNKIKITAFYS